MLFYCNQLKFYSRVYPVNVFFRDYLHTLVIIGNRADLLKTIKNDFAVVVKVRRHCLVKDSTMVFKERRYPQIAISSALHIEVSLIRNESLGFSKTPVPVYCDYLI